MNPLEHEPLPPIEHRTHFIAPSAFPLWIRETAKVQRFQGMENMIHRVDLYVHLRRVAVMTKNLYPLVDPGMPLERQAKIFRMAYHHDDPEVGTGDIPSQIKMGMTPEQKDELEQLENKWVERIADFIFHFVDPADRKLYIEEQKEIHEKKTPDARFLDVVDKLDGLGETMHELYCGNTDFFDVLENYRRRFESFEENPVWLAVSNDPAIGMDKFPEPEMFPKDPLITPEKVKKMESLWELSRMEGVHPWYRSWIGITTQEFDRGRPKFLFPGWADVWKRKEEPPVRTTFQGLRLV